MSTPSFRLTATLMVGVAVTLIAALLTTAPASAHDGHPDNPQHLLLFKHESPNPESIGITLEDYNERDQLIADQEALLNVYRCLFDIDTEIVPGGCYDQHPVRPPATPVPVTEVAKPDKVQKLFLVHLDTEDPELRYRYDFNELPIERQAVRELKKELRGPNNDGFVDLKYYTVYYIDREIELRDHLIIDQEALLNAYRCKFNVDTELLPENACINGEMVEAEFFIVDKPLQPFTPSFPGGYTLTGEELGCENFDPAPCRIGNDGFPEALRLLTWEEIVENVPPHTNPDPDIGQQFLHKEAPHAPIRSDDVAFRYINKCLRAWPAYTGSVLAEFRYDGDPDTDADDAPPIVACNAVWTMMALPLNFAGVLDIDCVWNEFEAFYFRHRPTVADRYGIELEPFYSYGKIYVNEAEKGKPHILSLVNNHESRRGYPAYIGWGEVCDSWLDPRTDLYSQFARIEDTLVAYRCAEVFTRHGERQESAEWICEFLTSVFAPFVGIHYNRQLRGHALRQMSFLLLEQSYEGRKDRFGHSQDRSRFPTPLYNFLDFPWWVTAGPY